MQTGYICSKSGIKWECEAGWVTIGVLYCMEGIKPVSGGIVSAQCGTVLSSVLGSLCPGNELLLSRAGLSMKLVRIYCEKLEGFGLETNKWTNMLIEFFHSAQELCFWWILAWPFPWDPHRCQQKRSLEDKHGNLSDGTIPLVFLSQAVPALEHGLKTTVKTVQTNSQTS